MPALLGAAERGASGAVTSQRQVIGRPQFTVRVGPTARDQEVAYDGSGSGEGYEPNRTRGPPAPACLQSRIPTSGFARCRNIRRSGRSGRRELVAPRVPRAATAVSTPAPPVTATRARGATRAGRTQQQPQDTSERLTDPGTGRRRASAEHRRPPKQQRPQGTPQGSPKVNEGGRASGRRREPKAMRTASAASGDEAPAEEVVPALPGKQGCSERSERNPPCVTTPYALLVWSHSNRPRALAAGGCGRGDLGKHSRISVLATGRRPATAARNAWSQGRYRCRVSPAWSGDALRPVSQEPDADGANPVFGFVAVSEPLGAQRLAGLHPMVASGSHGPRQRSVSAR